MSLTGAFPITLTVTSDLLAAESSVAAVLYAQISSDYPPTYGPSVGPTGLAASDWVYLWSGASGGVTVYDYASTSTVDAGDALPAFVTLTSATGQFYLPPVTASGRIYFGVPGVPFIGATATSAPVVAPVACNMPTIFDYVEFTYTQGATPVMNVDTSVIDQFGIPIQIVLDLSSGPNPLPNGSGVCLDQADVQSQFTASAPAQFQQCIQDLFLQPVASPLRILSPTDLLNYQCLTGVDASIPAATNPDATLNGTYYYGVTALDAAGNESYMQPEVVTISVATPQQVTVGWAPLSNQPQLADISAYNVYRAGSPFGPWTLVNPSPLGATGFPAGGALLDSGSSAGPASAPSGWPGPGYWPTNPLCTWFDAAIQGFFQYYDANGGNTLELVIEAAGYGTASGDTWQYSFSGTFGTDTVTGLQCLQFLITGVQDLTTNENVVSQMPFDSSTPFNLYYPYWNTNSTSTASPAPYTSAQQPSNCTPTPTSGSWMVNPDWPASMMVFANSGVFADNIEQAWFNLPSQVPAPVAETPPACYPNPPATGTAAYLWQSLLATLENMVVSAITRGVAAPIGTAAAPPLAPVNWANIPTQLAPTPVAGTPSSLAEGSPYYYVVTAVNEAGEGPASLEFSCVAPACTSQTGAGSIQVKWEPLGTATSYKVYRGTEPGGENTPVPLPPSGLTGTSQSLVDSGGGTVGQPPPPPRFYPAGATYNAYAAFFHQPTVSIAGAAYAVPFDDQGGQSTDQSGAASSLAITLGPWDAGCGSCG